MNFDQFIKSLICKVQLYIGNEYEIIEKRVTKNNGVVLTGLMAKSDGTNIYPTLYVDSMYEPDMKHEDVEYVAMKLAKSLRNAEVDREYSLDIFDNYEKARENIFFKLINAKQNKELLQDIPHRRVHDLAIVYFYLVEDEHFNGKGTILIKNEMTKAWSVTEDDLYSVALDNGRMKQPPCLLSMKDLLNEMAGNTIMVDDCSMYVLSNESKMYGASVILYEGYLKEIYDILGCNFYVLPSSIHEVILIPEREGISASGLLEMVTSVNSSEVSEEDILADSVYFYNSEKDILEWLI